MLYDTAVARESCGDAAMYVKPGDAGGLVRAIESLLFDDETRGDLLMSGDTELAKYNWSRAAVDTLTLLERC